MNDPYLLVLTEIASRKEIIELISGKISDSVIKGLDRIEKVVFKEYFKTIITDNGSEFKDYKGIKHLLQKVQF